MTAFERWYVPRRAVFVVFCLLVAFPVDLSQVVAKEAAYPAGGLYEEALKRFQDKDYRGAIIQLKNVLQANPENLPARILIGRAHLALGDALPAEKELRRAKVEGGDEELLAVPLASALLLMKRYEDILFTLPVENRSPDVEYGLQITHGQAYLALLQNDKAENAFQRAGRLKPGTAMPYVGLARVNLARSEFYDARKMASQAVAAEPENFYVWTLTYPSRIFFRSRSRRSSIDLSSGSDKLTKSAG